ncbi:serine dehydratase subunit alpha family protein [Diplocloster agilis]|uniref:L-cysteine desulfidase family protein n=1 Tax=Diplocloster agilis TaxID=2850323 RepID=UPI0008214C3F|nr:L-serine ammonia-lyase, iron-sulfur-dependent, subunit alpha [Suonthocola fibrivorans]MCU6736921.1 L-serine ammonia-lyase, iron-sulfur-dependent, subunit alpha [Suonthocola fibrivorans]SCJ94477.1 Serine dehydratase alpha chain [uncultured Clostridium sp.]
MDKKDKRYDAYLRILNKELIPAMGCTEPIAIAYCAAVARDTLGTWPDRVEIYVSGNIIKNVKSVIVPNTGNKKGLEAAAAAGIVAGNAARKLEVIAQVSVEQIEQMTRFLDDIPIRVMFADTECPLDIEVILYHGQDSARVHIMQEHTNIVLIEKNGEILVKAEPQNAPGTKGLPEASGQDDDYGLLCMEGIFDFAQTVAIEDVRQLLDQQIEYNTAIAREGLARDYGANIGSVLLKAYGSDIRTRAKAAAAAGSDARMDGCELPVVINSGSGNQGMTVSLPVIEYAKETGAGQETLYRALVLSNLAAIHQKFYIGRLSAYCGAVSAGAAAGAGITYLLGGGYSHICHTIVNALAITSGIVCDGAKPSCAAKIAASVDAGILGYEMYRNGQQFYGGDGVLAKGIENTLRNIGRLGKDGMKDTDKEIIRIMSDC